MSLKYKMKDNSKIQNEKVFKQKMKSMKYKMKEKFKI